MTPQRVLAVDDEEDALGLLKVVLETARIPATSVDEVLLVGGQSRMPLVHARVAAFFGRHPSRAVHPDEAVAIGAARGWIRSGATKPELTQESLKEDVRWAKQQLKR